MSVTIRNLTIVIGGKTIVSHVDLDIADGERVGLIGSSGSGKSMIAKAMMGLLPATAQVSGSIEMGGRRIVGATDADIADLRGRYVGMVFQNPAAALNPVMTVAQQISLPLYLHYDLTAAERAERIRVMLAKVGLDEDVLRKYPHELSGGQQQRVGIARAFVARPEVVFADEPTGNLDSKTKTDVMDMICAFAHDFNQTIVLVTHDDNMAQYADRIVTLLDGRIIDDRPVHHGRNRA
ncbi:MAG TPA: ABC transporter ATP-binding protein [Bifidobacterium dentium]|nr:ABC transporter ATP-binding protein [Bifidobacterium dentium]